MSTDPFANGGKAEVEANARDLQAELAAASAEEEQQGLFDEPMTAREMADAAESCGPNAGRLTVLKHVRAERTGPGRRKGSKNRANADLQAYLLQFGPDPLVAAMRVVAQDELDMVALSAQVDPTKKQLSFAEAAALRIRCMELVAPYVHGKQPVQVDATIRGVHVISQYGDGRAAGASDAVSLPKVMEAAQYEEISEGREGGNDA